MAHLRLIEPEDADGRSPRSTTAAVERAGKVYNIVRSMSLNAGDPPGLDGALQGDHVRASQLTRQERELLATVVSATNDCYY